MELENLFEVRRQARFSTAGLRSLKLMPLPRRCHIRVGTAARRHRGSQLCLNGSGWAVQSEMPSRLPSPPILSTPLICHP